MGSEARAPYIAPMRSSRTLLICAFLFMGLASVAEPPAGSHQGHAHGEAQTAPVPGLDPLKDAGVPEADRLKAVAGHASVAAGLWKAIRLCDRCLAANDLAALLAERPAAELQPLATELAAAVAQDGAPVIRAAAARALMSLPVDTRPESVRALAPRELATTCVPSRMAWDPREFTVTAGELVRLRMENPDSMQHNMLLTAPGSLSEIGVAAEKMGEGLEGKRRQFVPDSVKVRAVMGLVEPGKTGELWFFAPDKPGTWVLVCTYPGHYRMMNGKLRVKAATP
jgi:uncharacterized cupredoxin-like copper-binding protein